MNHVSRAYRARLSLTVRAVCLCGLIWAGIGYPSAFAARVADSPGATNGPATVSQINVIQSDAQAVVLDFHLGEYTLETETVDGQTFHRVQVAGLEQMLTPDLPPVPTRGTLIGLPTTDSVTVDVLDAHVVELAGYDLLPAPRFSVGDPGLIGAGETLSAPQLVESKEISPAWRDRNDFLPAAPVQIASIGDLRGQAVAQVQFYPIRYNPARRTFQIYHRITARVTWRATASPAHADVAFAPVLASSLANYESLAQGQPAAPAGAPETIDQSTGQSSVTRLARFTITGDGFYTVSYEDLIAQGVPAATLDALDPARLAVSNRGAQVAIEINDVTDGKFGPGDRILFYGTKTRRNSFAPDPAKANCPEFDAEQTGVTALTSDSIFTQAKPDHWYTDENVYWLVIANAPGERIANVKVTTRAGAAQPVTDFPVTRHFEDDTRYWQTMPSQECADRWYWDTRITPSHANTYTFALDGIVAPEEATLHVNLQGYTEVDHPFRITLNSQELTGSWSGQDAYPFRPEGPLTLRANNTMTVAVSSANPQANQFLLNSIRVRYRQRYDAANAAAFFFGKSSLASEQLRVTNINAVAAQVFDVTNPQQPRRMADAAGAGGDATTLVFQDDGANLETVVCGERTLVGRCYLAVTAAAIQSPAQVEAVAPDAKVLASADNGADYVIITNDELLPAAQRLADYRAQASQFATQVVTVRTIYDDFNAGLVNPRAIRDFLDFAVHCWQRPPAYVVLLGDANQDYKDKLGVGNNIVPSYSFESTLFGEISSDTWYASLIASQDLPAGWCQNPVPLTAARDSLPDLFIGRLSVASAAEAEAVINKIVAYEQTPLLAEWKKNVLLVSDDDAKFGETVRLLQAAIPASHRAIPLITPDKANNQLPNAMANEIIARLNEGQLIVSYLGHGDYNAWGRWDAGVDPGAPEEHYIFHRDYMLGLTNGDKLPVLTVGNCLNGFFAGPTSVSALGEEFLRKKSAGAIAVWAPTGLGLPSGHRVLLEAFHNAMLDQDDRFAQYDERSLGVAANIAYTQTYAANRFWKELVWTYVLLGDPAMKVSVPKTSYLPALRR